MKALAWFVGALVSASCVTAAAQAEPYSGAADFQTYCSACHGGGGKGDGSIAKSLKKHPPDLTQLASRSKGVFPDDTVFKSIDSRQPGSAHADSDMPAWGDVFAKSSESPGADNAAQRIHTLVAYVKTLQTTP